MKSAVFGRSLCALILALVPALSRAEQELVARYTFDEGSGTVAGDSSGNGFTGTLVNGPTWATGVRNGALSFNGVDSYVNVPNNSTLNVRQSDFALCAWVKPAQFINQMVVASKERRGDGSDFLGMYCQTSQRVLVACGGSGEPDASVTSNATLAINQWTHLAFVREGTKHSLYINGVLDSFLTTSSIGDKNNSYDWRIGARYPTGGGNDPDQVFNGQIDDVQLHTRAFTAGQILALYLNNVAAAPDFYIAGNSQPLTVSAPGVLANDGDPEQDPLTAVLDTTTLHGTLALNTDGSFTYTSANGFSGTDTFTYHANDGHGNDSPAATVIISVADTLPGLIAGYRFDEGAGVVANDWSGNGFNGLLLGNPTWTAGINGGALAFDGAGTFVNIPDNAMLNVRQSDCALCAWVKPAQLVESMMIAGKERRGDGSDFFGYQIRTTQKVLVAFGGSGEPDGSVTSIASVPLNQWTHIAFVREGTAHKLYINGVLDATVVTPSVGDKLNSYDWRIGTRYPTGGGNGVDQVFNGLIDDVRLYGRALSAAQVNLLAQAPPTTTADFYVAPKDQALSVAAPGVLSNDTDVNGDTLTAVKDTDPAHGTLSLNSNGSFTYTPQNGFTGTDMFTYHANDGHGNDSAAATVTIDVSDIPAGLLAWYKFDEDSGTIANDSTGNGNTGALEGGPTWGSGVLAGALNLDGVNDKITLPDNLIHNRVIITVSMWFRTSVNGVLIGYQSPSGANNDPLLYVGTDGKLRGEFWQGSVSPITTVTAVNNGGWHHVAIVGSTNTQSLYLDGSLVGTLSGGINHLDMSKNQLGLGLSGSWPGSPATWSYLNGALDDVRIYNRVLSAGEIANLAQLKPAAAGDTFTANINKTLNISSPGVLTNDSSPSGSPLTAVLDTSVAHGGLTLASDGSFSYVPDLNFLGTDSFTYHCNDGTNNSTPATATIQVTKATPVITWSNPAAITYGTALSATQLSATADTQGTFAYTPAAGTILGAGNNHNLSVTFTPNDSANYSSATKSVSLTVSKVALTVTADNKTKLFGVANPPLTASYSGFVNNETAAVLTGTPTLATAAATNSPPGNYPITITQGTLNAANYSFTFVNGALTISNTPAFSNLSAPTIEYGTVSTTISGRISFGVTGAVSITLNGVSKSATIDGTGAFAADFGTASLDIGNHPIQYSYPGGGAVGPATDSKTLTVVKANPVLTWANPADIPFGTQLSSTQLNATANVAGTFVYTPPAGTVLAKGTHQLSTNFTPTDSAHYVSASASVTLIVGLAEAVITWATPADISYGTALSDTQLNATADIPGTFAYSPPSGTILDAGDAQKLSLVFTPNDIVNYAESHVDVFINVLKADQSITFAQIADQEIGNPPLTVSASASSNLPATIVLVSGNAALQGGTLTLTGLGAITLRAEQAGDANVNAAPALEQTFHVIIIPPSLINALSANGTQNQVFTFTFTATGTRPVTFESGTLPPGLSLNANTGEIAGTPTASGAFQISVTARNGGGTDTKTLTLVFTTSGGGENHAPNFTSAPTAAPNPAIVNKDVDFSAAGTDEDGDSVAIVWDFGDGTQGSGASATHKYASTGVFSAKVTITDGLASDYLNITVVVNATVIPIDQYKQYAVAKLGLKFNFAKANTDSLSISGTIPIPPAFSPTGKVVKFESGGLEREWALDKKATSADKAFKLTGKFAKDGTFSASPAKFALALKNQDLFTGLAPLGFLNDNTPKGMIVSMPVILILEGTGYLATIDVKYAAKKGKSGSGKK